MGLGFGLKPSFDQTAGGLGPRRNALLMLPLCNPIPEGVGQAKLEAAAVAFHAENYGDFARNVKPTFLISP